MAFAEHAATQIKDERGLTFKDSLIIGFTQCLSLIPGVSRSGATITAGLLRDLDRVTATRLSFFLGIPALTAAGAYELKDALGGVAVSTTTLAVGTVVSFVVAYASIAWLLRFVAHHTLLTFVWYRVLLGAAIIGLLVTGTIQAY
jgi:undecaprenyl-diphosphatase